MTPVCVKAKPSDLPEVTEMFRGVVARMFQNGIDLWNDFYPTDELPDDIENQRLYVLKRGNEIVAAFVLFDRLPMQHCFEWRDKNAQAVYVSRLGVRPAYARQGLGGLALDTAADISKEQGATYLRLLVAVENTPAMGLYRKNGFEQVAGSTDEFFASLNRVVTELGFEKRIG